MFEAHLVSSHAPSVCRALVQRLRATDLNQSIFIENSFYVGKKLVCGLSLLHYFKNQFINFSISFFFRWQWFYFLFSFYWTPIRFRKSSCQLNFLPKVKCSVFWPYKSAVMLLVCDKDQGKKSSSFVIIYEIRVTSNFLKHHGNSQESHYNKPRQLMKKLKNVWYHNPK